MLCPHNAASPHDFRGDGLIPSSQRQVTDYTDSVDQLFKLLLWRLGFRSPPPMNLRVCRHQRSALVTNHQTTSTYDLYYGDRLIHYNHERICEFTDLMLNSISLVFILTLHGLD